MARRMRWLLSLGMLGVLLLALGACDNGEVTLVATVTTPPPLPSRVTFTVSGGLSGTYSITSQNFMNSQYHTDEGLYRDLEIRVADNSWEFQILLKGGNIEGGDLLYSGPTGYDMSNGFGYVIFASADQTKIWDFAAGAKKAECEVSFESDSSWPSAGSSLTTELKGIFYCPQLNSDGLSQEQPISITNGQFDVFAENVV